jgi:hypothetical protein
MVMNRYLINLDSELKHRLTDYEIYSQSGQLIDIVKTFDKRIQDIDKT